MIGGPSRRAVGSAWTLTVLVVLAGAVLAWRVPKMSVGTRHITDLSLGLLLTVGLVGTILIALFIGPIAEARRASAPFGTTQQLRVARQLQGRQLPAPEYRGLATTLVDQAVATWWLTHLLIVMIVVVGSRAAVADDLFGRWLFLGLAVALVPVVIWGERRRRRIIAGYREIVENPMP